MLSIDSGTGHALALRQAVLADQPRAPIQRSTLSSLTQGQEFHPRISLWTHYGNLFTPHPEIPGRPWPRLICRTRIQSRPSVSCKAGTYIFLPAALLQNQTVVQPIRFFLATSYFLSLPSRSLDGAMGREKRFNPIGAP